MASAARIPSAPSPSLTTNATADTKSSPQNRIVPTESTICEQVIGQQRQQTKECRLPQLPLTPLGYQLTQRPKRYVQHASNEGPTLPAPADRSSSDVTCSPVLNPTPACPASAEQATLLQGNDAE